MTIDELIPRRVSKIEFSLLLTVIIVWVSVTVLVNLRLGKDQFLK